MSDTTQKQTSGLAIAGLVLGILAAVTSFLPIINNLSAILAVIGGILAVLALIGALRGKHTAKGLSIAGVVLAVVSFAIVLATQSMYSAALDSALDEATSGAQPVSTGDTPAEPADDATDQAAQEPAEEAEPQADYSNLAVGETVQLSDGLSITVNSVETGLVNYDDSLVTCVNVTYTNNGSGSASFNTYDWKGEDANGAQRDTAFFTEGSDELSSGTLSAGGTVTGNIYFEDGTVRVVYYSNVFADEPAAGWAL